MANIYNEQGITQTPVAKIGEMSTASEVKQSAKYFEAIQDNFERKAKEHQALAEKIYENGSNIAITQGLNELSRNPKYANNPEAFALEADKMAEKIYAQIDDPNMKTEVAMNYELKKNPYINRAYDNMYKLQNEQYEAQVVAGIQENMDAMGMSLNNIMSGTMGVDDLRTLSESKKRFDNYLNAKNAQGFSVFTPKERMALEKQYNKNVLDGLKNGFDNLTPEVREQIANGVDDDITTLRKVKYNDQEFSFGARNVLPDNMVSDIKKYIKDGVHKDKQNKIREFNLMRQESRVNFLQDPTETNLNSFLAMNPDASDATVARLRSLIKDNVSNELAETDAEAYSNALEMISGLTSNEYLTKDGKFDNNAQFEDAIKVMEYIQKQNSANGKLTNANKDLLVQQVADALIGGEAKKTAEAFSAESKNFLSAVWAGIKLGFGFVDDVEGSPKLLRVKEPFIKREVIDTINAALNAYQTGDIEGAKQIYKKGKEKIIIMRNPEVEGKNVGDKVVINGKVYTFMGLSQNDIIVSE